MFTRIFADNFRALVNFELRPDRRLSLLLGGNGSGKTSVLNVLGSLRDLIILGSSSSELFSYSRTKWDKRDVQRFELDIQESEGTYRYTLEVQHPAASPDKPFIRSESVTFDGEPLYRLSDEEVHLFYDDRTTGPIFPFRSDRSFLTNLDTAPAHRMGRLGRFRDLVAGIAIIQPDPFAMDIASKQDQSFLMRRGLNFASFFEFLNAERPEVRSKLETRLTDAIPGFRNLMLKRLGDTKVILAVLGDDQHKGEFNLWELSEGQRVLAVLYAAVFGLLRSGSLLCFDEPDNFVSLSEIQPWLQVLRDALEAQDGQALIVSHHPEVIDYLALDAKWQFERPAGPVIARPLEVSGYPDLKLSEIIARGV